MNNFFEIVLVVLIALLINSVAAIAYNTILNNVKFKVALLFVFYMLVFTLSGYFIYRYSGSLLWAFSAAIFLAIYHALLEEKIAINREERTGVLRDKSSRIPLFFRFSGIIPYAVAFAYLGYLIAGGKFSISILIIILVSWLLSIIVVGRRISAQRETEVDRMKKSLHQRMNELNAMEWKEEDDDDEY